jgi:hypothetical protein
LEVPIVADCVNSTFGIEQNCVPHSQRGLGEGGGGVGGVLKGAGLVVLRGGVRDGDRGVMMMMEDEYTLIEGRKQRGDDDDGRRVHVDR